MLPGLAFAYGRAQSAKYGFMSMYGRCHWLVMLCASVVKVNQSRYRPIVAQRVPESSQIS